MRERISRTASWRPMTLGVECRAERAGTRWREVNNLPRSSHLVIPAKAGIALAVAYFEAKSFRAPSEHESLSLACPRESNQREGHPAWRLPGAARQVREPGPGFSTVPRATAPALPQLRHPSRRHVLSIPLRACRPRLTAAQGIGDQERRAEQERSKSCTPLFCPAFDPAFASAVALASPKSARRERAALPGAPMTRRAGGGKARRGPDMDVRPFGVSTGCAVDKPRNLPAHLEGRMPARRVIGVALSLGYFSLATQREVTRPPQEDESCCFKTSKQRAIPAFAGMTRCGDEPA